MLTRGQIGGTVSLIGIVTAFAAMFSNAHDRRIMGVGLALIVVGLLVARAKRSEADPAPR